MGLTFIMMLAFGALTAYLAKRQGKNPYVWFILGILFGIFGLFFLFFNPVSKKQAKSAPETAPGPTTIDITPKVTSVDKDKFWYYLDAQNKQFGPMSFDALRRAWQEGTVTQETYVWNENLEHWKRFGEFIQAPQPTV